MPNSLPASVLIVDDEAGIRELLSRWLGAAGYRASQAPSAEAAVTMLAGDGIDVVLADMQMPGAGGLWLLQQIREHFPRVAIILATADSEVRGTVTLQHGVVGYVVKPFAKELVVKAVEGAIQWREAEVAAARARRVDDVEDWLGHTKLSQPPPPPTDRGSAE
jgi:DNA-binding NtrC family response regulator